MQVLLGVDRVDYIKGVAQKLNPTPTPTPTPTPYSITGIPQKLLAVETLLEAHPEYVGKVRAAADRTLTPNP